MKRALIFGGTGMLGQAVAGHWRRRGRAVLSLPRIEADITHPNQLLEWVERFRPEVVINCAAMTQVDACEKERSRAMRVNGEAVTHVVAAAERVSAFLVHISSDYVFDGRGYGGFSGPAPYPEDAPTDPQSVYGQSKLLGETNALAYERTLVLRSSWLFGPGGSNFVTTMRRIAKEGRPLQVVDDQVGCPTYTPFLARAIWDLLGTGLRGITHYCNRDAVSWYDFAREILGPEKEITPVTTAELSRPAPRPAYSALAVERFEKKVGRRVEPWIHGLATYLETLGEGS